MNAKASIQSQPKRRAETKLVVKNLPTVTA